MARKTVRILAIAAGGLLGMFALAYLSLLVINWKDRPPSATAERFQAFYDARPTVPDAQNAYTFMLGFSGGPDADPLELGRRRQAWFRTAFSAPVAEIRAGDPLVPYDYVATRPDEIAPLARACRHFDQRCADALGAPGAAAARWLDAERWLLDRYVRLISFTQHRAQRRTIGTPFPDYARIFEGQRLLLLRAWLALEAVDRQRVERDLNDDFAFWRRLDASADSVTGKMVAVAAATRSLEMGNLLSRHAWRSDVELGLPASWRIQIAEEERSMHRSLIGEWESKNDLLRTPALVPHSGILSPFWQPQAASNEFAAMMLRAIRLSDQPYARLPGAYAQTKDEPLPASGPFGQLYNLTGNLVLGPSYDYNYGRYVVRAADLEGIRRAALAAWQLRAAGVKRADVAARLAAGGWRNPYSGKPLEWDASAGTIVFSGLGPRPLRALVY